ncbi:MAG TPA: hypothetical protein DEP66_03955 [Acidimicrobiaceae bacterium]|nr:hypothetical protein [Acidimicrobiaceae bacterium]
MAVALTAAACAGGSSAAAGESAGETAGQIASLEGSSADGAGSAGRAEVDALAAVTTTQPVEEITFEEAQLNFAACMRLEYPDWPDPDPDEGGFGRQAVEASGIDFRSDEFRQAVDGCRVELEGLAGVGGDLTPEEEAERDDRLLALFACVRETPGFENLPDVDLSGNGSGFDLRALFGSGEFDPQTFRQRMQDCQAELGVEGAERGFGGRRGQGAPRA